MLTRGIDNNNDEILNDEIINISIFFYLYLIQNSEHEKSWAQKEIELSDLSDIDNDRKSTDMAKYLFYALNIVYILGLTIFLLIFSFNKNFRYFLFHYF